VYQHGLFDLSPLALTDDNEGGIHYLPASISVIEADRWFVQLLHNVAWTSHRRMMYEREVAVPRLLATYPAEASDLPEPLTHAFETVRSLLGAPFNRVGLNLYRNGNDSVAPHNDKTEHLVPGQPIAILSLGATRRMSIRPKTGPARPLNLDLEAGSILVMSHASQFTHDHGIPKTAGVEEARISLAFRCFEE
jgi:alkylated DNA repair dioxygenase AlkB